jgi:hypothetical protein
MNYDAVWRIFIIFLTLTAKCVTRVNVDGGENAGKPPDAHLVHPFEKCPARFAPALAARSKHSRPPARLNFLHTSTLMPSPTATGRRGGRLEAQVRLTRGSQGRRHTRRHHVSQGSQSIF